MQQKEEMYQEGTTGGAGSAQSSASENEKSYGWAKWVAFGIVISALAVGLVLTFIK